MTSRKPPPTISLAMALLARFPTCRDRVRKAAEQFRESRDDEDASRIAQETIDFLTHCLKSFQIAGRPPYLIVLVVGERREGVAQVVPSAGALIRAFGISRGSFPHRGDGFFYQPANAMRTNDVAPCAVKRSNPEVSSGSALCADFTRPGATIVARLDGQHYSLPVRDEVESDTLVGPVP